MALDNLNRHQSGLSDGHVLPHTDHPAQEYAPSSLERAAEAGQEALPIGEEEYDGEDFNDIFQEEVDQYDLASANPNDFLLPGAVDDTRWGIAAGGERVTQRTLCVLHQRGQQFHHPDRRADQHGDPQYYGRYVDGRIGFRKIDSLAVLAASRDKILH